MPTAKKTAKKQAPPKKKGTVKKAVSKGKTTKKSNISKKTAKASKPETKKKLTTAATTEPLEQTPKKAITENPASADELIREEVSADPLIPGETDDLLEINSSDEMPAIPETEIPPDIETRIDDSLDSKPQTEPAEAVPESYDEQIRDVEDATLEEELQLVCFTLNNEEYGINISQVQEINRVPDINEVPDTADFVKGVINLRGRIIPVIEMRLLLGLPEREYDHKTRIVVLDSAGILTGIVVDDVTQVLRIRRSLIVDTPELASTTGKEFLQGIYQHDKKLILVVDCEKVFNFDKR